MIDLRNDSWVCTCCGGSLRICEHHKRDAAVYDERYQMMARCHKNCVPRVASKPHTRVWFPPALLDVSYDFGAMVSRIEAEMSATSARASRPI